MPPDSPELHNPTRSLRFSPNRISVQVRSIDSQQTNQGLTKSESTLGGLFIEPRSYSQFHSPPISLVPTNSSLSTQSGGNSSMLRQNTPPLSGTIDTVFSERFNVATLERRCELLFSSHPPVKFLKPEREQAPTRVPVVVPTVPRFVDLRCIEYSWM